jgi:hypothetical protein
VIFRDDLLRLGVVENSRSRCVGRVFLRFVLLRDGTQKADTSELLIGSSVFNAAVSAGVE